MISEFSQLDLSKRYSYADYMTWKFQERVELIRGWVMKMSPAPNRKHQEIVGEIYRQIANFLHQKECKVFTAPFDVRLPIPSKSGKMDTVLQPDIVVVCDRTKLDEQGCVGAPDIVVEVLSPGNTKREMKYKLDIYQEALVKEYWLVDPEHEFAIIYTLDKTHKYIGSTPYTEEDLIKSSIIKGFELDLGTIFNQE